MEYPLVRKELRKVVGLVICFVALMSFISFPSMGSILIAAVAAYLGVGIDYLRKEKEAKRLKDYLSEKDEKENIHYLLDTYLTDVGRGHLAVTDRWVFFIKRKGDIYVLTHLHNVTNFGNEYVGSGIYVTRHSQSSIFKGSSTSETKLPTFFFEVTTSDGENRTYQFFTKKYKQAYKTFDNLIDNGVVAKEKQTALKEQKDSQHRFELENGAIIKEMDLIMDRDLNALDNANSYFLQNLGVYVDALFDVLSKKIPKLLSLKDDEKEDLQEYLTGCAFRGNRMGKAVINSYESFIDESDLNNVIIPGELAQEKAEEVTVPEYPAMQTIVYSQYKYFRNLNFSLLTEDEALYLTKEYIRIGAKNTIANYLALDELKKGLGDRSFVPESK